MRTRKLISNLNKKLTLVWGYTDYSEYILPRHIHDVCEVDKIMKRKTIELHANQDIVSINIVKPDSPYYPVNFPAVILYFLFLQWFFSAPEKRQLFFCLCKPLCNLFTPNGCMPICARPLFPASLLIFGLIIEGLHQKWVSLATP